ncbi:hypothetical protein [Pseudomonas sp.]|nr:hypothetical protein [Pseudomonas sp.]
MSTGSPITRGDGCGCLRTNRGQPLPKRIPHPSQPSLPHSLDALAAKDIA